MQSLFDYKDRGWLKTQYVDKEIPATKIAKMAHTTASTIYRWLDKFSIKRRDSGYRGGKQSRQCKQCGKVFNYWPSSERKFCSQKCYLKWWNKQEIGFKPGKKNNNWKEKEIVKCKNCGDKFKVPPSHVGHKVFCSIDCQAEWRSKNIKGQKHPNWKGKMELTCEYCGETYKVHPYRIEQGSRFCSEECYGRWISENLSGSKHPSWKGGSSEYKAKLEENLGNWNGNRIKALERDDHICQFCGKEENGKEHDVHHIKPVRRGGSNYVGNLITLCRSCHREIESSLEKEE